MKKLFIAMMAAGFLSACSTAPEKKADTTTEASQAVNDDLYIVMDERMNVFYDGDLYKKYMEHGETPYRRTFIGAGPNGETVVYGLTKDDKKKTTNPAEEMMSGKMAPAEDFYAEVVEKEHNRIYVFTSWATFDEFVKLHVDNFRYSDIGAGPNGETVVYVLTKKTSKQKPVEAMKKFNTFHGIQK
ncbi:MULTISPECIES: hypothetical protein [Piscirickettsiaceae]|jgi:hypothetical protein|uniref:Uncharacterized protein n=1 Tax=Hydrogenovibrio thermophilus TaxID=265883 RepID=A0A451G5B0_9GAMM|nr:MULTISPECIES: hypothetical protein [Piscirickettsiaceae]AZR82737.1 hypothetical protein AYJ59_10910 [Thiomicrospira sp. S5]QAB14690.1 hypothetical protein EPV75_02895 [Hydrogenovibrio thermophilus]